MVVDVADVVLVAEIESPSTVQIDRLLKSDLYAQAGIPTMLLVDPDGPAVTVLRLGSDGAYSTSAEVKGDESVTLTEPFKVTIVPSALVTVRAAKRDGAG